MMTEFFRIGELATLFWVEAGSNWYSVSWSYEMPPSAAFGMAYLGDLVLGTTAGSCSTGLLSYRLNIKNI